MIRSTLSRSLASLSLLLFVLCALAACGETTERPASASADEEEEWVCNLLTDDQVATVLPGHDGGFVAASGASLVEGEKIYQCSYSVPESVDFDLMTVIVTVDSDAEYFETWTKPKPGPKQEMNEIYRDLDVADGGMLYGDPDDIEVEVWKGTTLISLGLDKDGAAGLSEELIALASRVAGQID